MTPRNQSSSIISCITALFVRTYRIRLMLNPVGLGLSTGSMGLDQRDSIGLEY